VSVERRAISQVHIQFLGSGDAFGSGGRFQTALFLFGADLFICEAYFFEKKIRYHLDYQTLLNQRDRLKCRRLVLTHMSQDMLNHSDELEIDHAEDGRIIVL
jgi:ribonuclease BN (tRNA processing enzyme)